MKTFWFYSMLIVLITIYLASCDSTDSDDNDNIQYISCKFNGKEYYITNKISAVYTTSNLFTDIYFLITNDPDFDTIRIALFNTDLEEIPIPHKYKKYPANHLTDLYAGIVLTDKTSDDEFTFISGYSTGSDTSIIEIEGIWFKEFIRSFLQTFF